jgi:hypothetical protein
MVNQLTFVLPGQAFRRYGGVLGNTKSIRVATVQSRRVVGMHVVLL